MFQLTTILESWRITLRWIMSLEEIVCICGRLRGMAQDWVQ
jgi:hypothetical protein